MRCLYYTDLHYSTFTDKQFYVRYLIIFFLIRIIAQERNLCLREKSKLLFVFVIYEEIINIYVIFMCGKSITYSITT